MSIWDMMEVWVSLNVEEFWSWHSKGQSVLTALIFMFWLQPSCHNWLRVERDISRTWRESVGTLVPHIIIHEITFFSRIDIEFNHYKISINSLNVHLCAGGPRNTAVFGYRLRFDPTYNITIAYQQPFATLINLHPQTPKLFLWTNRCFCRRVKMLRQIFMETISCRG